MLILLQLNLVWWHIILRWIVLWKDWIALLWSRSQKRFSSPVNVHLDDISSAAEPSVNKLGMVMQHHGPKCHTRVFCCCLQAGSQWGLIWSNMTVSVISAEMLIFLQPNLIGWYIVISWSALCQKEFCFQGQDHSEDSKLYWIFMYLISCVPLISWQPKVCWFTIHSNQTK